MHKSFIEGFEKQAIDISTVAKAVGNRVRKVGDIGTRLRVDKAMKLEEVDPLIRGKFLDQTPSFRKKLIDEIHTINRGTKGKKNLTVTDIDNIANF